MPSALRSYVETLATTPPRAASKPVRVAPVVEHNDFATAQDEGWITSFALLIVNGNSLDTCARRLGKPQVMLARLLSTQEFTKFLQEVEEDSRKNLSAPLLVGSTFDSVQVLLGIRDSKTSTAIEKLRAISQLESMKSALSVDDLSLASNEPLEQSMEIDSRLTSLLSDPTLRQMLKLEQQSNHSLK